MAKVRIREFGVTIDEKDYYYPDFVIQNPKFSLLTSCLFTLVYMASVAAGPELFLSFSVVFVASVLMKRDLGSSDKKIFDLYRFAFDLITIKTFGQPEHINKLQEEPDIHQGNQGNQDIELVGDGYPEGQ